MSPAILLPQEQMQVTNLVPEIPLLITTHKSVRHYPVNGIFICRNQEFVV